MYNNRPNSLKIAQQTSILHTLRVQVCRMYRELTRKDRCDSQWCRMRVRIASTPVLATQTPLNETNKRLKVSTNKGLMYEHQHALSSTDT